MMLLPLFVISGLLSCYLIREIDRENKKKEKQGMARFSYCIFHNSQRARRKLSKKLRKLKTKRKRTNSHDNSFMIIRQTISINDYDQLIKSY